jgi:hypothetical protein
LREKGKTMLRPLLVISALAFAAGQAHAAEAGKVIFAAGAVQIADKTGAEGTAVQEGELLVTGNDGFLYVKTVDNGLFILRPNTKAKIVSYQVDRQNPANTRIKLELISGTARSKSGDAVKLARQNFRFNTPVAAIGVRGTDFTVYTDQETSRVAVLTGGVVVSGFAGACRPEGGGPCEGAASRELYAAQRGQLLQVKRGDTAPQLLQSTNNGPDQVSPPRADEPVAKTGGTGNTTAPILEARKSDTLDKLVNQAPPPPPAQPPSEPLTMPPSTPTEHQPELPGPIAQVPVEPTQPTQPVEVVEPAKPVPPLPERALQWGRWFAMANAPSTITLDRPAGADQIIGGDYVIYRTAGRDYVSPERGSVSFKLAGGEAVVRYDDLSKPGTIAHVQNGLLNVDFGKASFVTSFDLVNGSETFRMMADGALTSSGRFGNGSYDVAVRPQNNNMEVNGALSNADGGTAAYVFSRRLDEGRTTNGVTFWAK